MLSDPPDPTDLDEQPSEAALRQAFGEDYDLAMEIWREHFTCSPSETSREWLFLPRAKESCVTMGRMGTGWMGDGPWIVVYVPEANCWEQFRDPNLKMLGERLTSPSGSAQ